MVLTVQPENPDEFAYFFHVALQSETMMMVKNASPAAIATSIHAPAVSARGAGLSAIR
jgi:hypothetical protein